MSTAVLRPSADYTTAPGRSEEVAKGQHHRPARRHPNDISQSCDLVFHPRRGHVVFFPGVPVRVSPCVPPCVLDTWKI